MADMQIQNLIQDNKIKNLEKAALLADIQQTDIRQEAITACLQGAQLKKLKMIAGSESKHLLKDRKVKKKRGRQSTLVNFGATKNKNVARLIMHCQSFQPY
jgi:hypothetical protein